MSVCRKKNHDEKLVVQMMETSGIDIETELVGHANGASRMRTAMLRCGRCLNAEDCQKWLVENAGSDVGSPPDYCLNKDLIRTVREG